MSRALDLIRNRLSRLGRRTRWTFAILAGTVALAVLPSFLIDEPLRRSVEGQMNARLTGDSVRLTGKFMGSGDGAVTARFRPEKKGPDFDVNLSLENTDLRTLNDVLRAYGKFDVAAGTFSLFSEIAVKDNRIEGYVKPLFRNVDVYDPVQDRDKSLGRKLYEKVVEGASKLLKNAPRKEVATVATISGPVEDVKAHTVEVVVKLLQNAFFKAILPGFDEQVRLTGRHK